MATTSTLTTTPLSDAYERLRRECLQQATREFRARGKSIARCEHCQLASFACICPWCKVHQSHCDFVLLMHRKEVFKPTNSGRFIARILPQNTHVFLWSRTQPDPVLLALLQDPARDCFLIYPCEDSARQGQLAVAEPGRRRPTFILLDGTWKQSSRMFQLSQWLQQIPCLSLPEQLLRGYAVRKSHQENYLSTLEAAGLCLQMAGEQPQASYCLDFFTLFNQHYLATRGCYQPVPGELHQRISGA